MDNSIARIRHLAGLTEAVGDPHVLSPDEADEMDDREDDARHMREQNIITLITRTFAHLGLAVFHDEGTGIHYDEDGRQATVHLEDSTLDLGHLAGLLRSGLAEKYAIEARNHAIDIEFIVSSDLDSV